MIKLGLFFSLVLFSFGANAVDVSEIREDLGWEC